MGIKLSYKVWLGPTTMTLLGLAMLYAAFLVPVVKESDLILLIGTLREKGVVFGGRYDKHLILNVFNNEFSDSYSSRRKFRRELHNGDSIYVHIRMKDLRKLNSGKKINIWSLRINHGTLYTPTQKLNQQAFYRKHIFPAFGVVCLLVAWLLFKYLQKKHEKKSKRKSIKNLS